MKSARGSVVCVCILMLASRVAVSDECTRPEDRPRSGFGIASAPTATTFYYSAAGTLLEADSEEGSLLLDLGSQGEVQFPLDAGLKMSADKRTRLHGIKSLNRTDFQRGDRVFVRLDSRAGRVIRLKLKRPKK